MTMRNLHRAFFYVFIALMVISVAQVALGQATLPQGGADPANNYYGAGPSDIGQAYYDAANTWITNIKPIALNLFWALAGIDLTWTLITLVLQHQELQGFMAGFIKKILTISFFGVLLANGPQWISAIVTFFIYVGTSAGGRSTASLSASAIMGQGIQVGAQMLKAAAGANGQASSFSLFTGFSNIGPALTLVLGALLVVLAYVIVALHFIMALVETYIVIGAGYIFLGFGGSRWTVPYTEKYIGMVVSAGVRLMVIQLMINLGNQLYPKWSQMAQNITIGTDFFAGATVGTAWNGVQLEFALVSSILIFALLAWTLPQLAANVVSGSLSFSGSDALGAAAAGGAAGAAVANFANTRSGDSEASKSAVSAVQQAAQTGAQMGVQVAMAAATGGTSAAASGAAAAGGAAGGAGGAGGAFSGIGGAMAGGMDGKTPPVPGGEGGSGGGAGSNGNGNGSNSASRGGTPPPPSRDTDSGRGESEDDSSGDLVGALHGLAKEGQSALRQMPGGSARVGGTNPNIGHGE